MVDVILWFVFLIYNLMLGLFGDIEIKLILYDFRYIIFMILFLICLVYIVFNVKMVVDGCKVWNFLIWWNYF